MGAATFITEATGETATVAFNNAVSAAQYEHGHGGYTGTIAEKRGFVMIRTPEGADGAAEAQRLINDGDDRIDNKWGPAGCIDLGGGKFLFFGWASC